MAFNISLCLFNSFISHIQITSTTTVDPQSIGNPAPHLAESGFDGKHVVQVSAEYHEMLAITSVEQVNVKSFVSILIDRHEGVNPADFITCEINCDEFWKVKCSPPPG